MDLKSELMLEVGSLLKEDLVGLIPKETLTSLVNRVAELIEKIVDNSIDHTDVVRFKKSLRYVKKKSLTNPLLRFTDYL
jgi:hypothetical protein